MAICFRRVFRKPLSDVFWRSGIVNWNRSYANSDYMVGRSLIETQEREKQKQKDEDVEKDGFDPKYKEFSLFGVDRESKRNKNVDLNKGIIFKKIIQF